MPRQFLHVLVCAFWTVLHTIEIDLLQYCCSRHAGYWFYLHCPTLRYLDAPIRPAVRGSGIFGASGSRYVHELVSFAVVFGGLLSSTAQIVQSHESRLKPLHEKLGIRKTCSDDSKALHNLIADRRAPVTECQIVFQSGIGAVAIEEAKLNRSSHKNSMCSLSVFEMRAGLRTHSNRHENKAMTAAFRCRRM